MLIVIIASILSKPAVKPGNDVKIAKENRVIVWTYH